MATRNASLWWWNPCWTLACVALPLAVVAALLPETAYAEYWHTMKYFGLTHAFLVALYVGAFALGTAGALLIRPRNQHQRPDWESMSGVIGGLFNLAFYMTIVGYVAFIVAAAARGLGFPLVLAVLQQQAGAVDTLKDTYFQTVPGVTTFTQFGMAAMLLGALVAGTRGLKSVRVKLCMILVLATLRSFFDSERLALLELLIPCSLLYLRMKYADWISVSRSTKFVLKYLPFIGVGALAVLFTVFEIPRSWSYWSATQSSDLWSFGLRRFLGYYVTSLNNGVLLSMTSAFNLKIPYYTLEWLWNAPGLGSLLNYDALTGSAFNQTYHAVLATSANDEFNTPGGIFLPLLDFGPVLSAAFWVIWGFVAGKLFSAFCRGTIAGLLLYPLFYVGLLESPRILYWFAGRVFPSWVFLLVVLVALSMEARKLAWRRPGAIPAWAGRGTSLK